MESRCVHVCTAGGLAGDFAPHVHTTSLYHHRYLNIATMPIALCLRMFCFEGGLCIFFSRSQPLTATAISIDLDASASAMGGTKSKLAAREEDRHREQYLREQQKVSLSPTPLPVALFHTTHMHDLFLFSQSSLQTTPVPVLQHTC
jgi:hypothetical protein